jgi:hypothetical protein
MVFEDRHTEIFCMKRLTIIYLLIPLFFSLPANTMQLPPHMESSNQTAPLASTIATVLLLGGGALTLLRNNPQASHFASALFADLYQSVKKTKKNNSESTKKDDVDASKSPIFSVLKYVFIATISTSAFFAFRVWKILAQKKSPQYY